MTLVLVAVSVAASTTAVVLSLQTRRYRIRAEAALREMRKKTSKSLGGVDADDLR